MPVNDRKCAMLSKFRITPHQRIKFEDVCVYFSLPLVVASQKLGVSPSFLKKLCRHIGVLSWPYRKLSRLQNSLFSLRIKLQQPLCMIEKKNAERQVDVICHDIMRLVQRSLSFSLTARQERMLQNALFPWYSSMQMECKPLTKIAIPALLNPF